MNEAILRSVEFLILVSHPVLGKWSDASAITYSKRIEELQNSLRSLRVQARALDLLAVVPGV
jgi:hypothetical protein